MSAANVAGGELRGVGEPAGDGRRHDPDAQVRSTAWLLAGALARAGRTESPGEAEAIDAALIARPAVRADAIFAAGFRRGLDPRLGEALLRAAKDDPIGYVRSNAVTLLRRNPGVVPGIAETLAWIAENDSKPAIRRLAREALTSINDRRW